MAHEQEHEDTQLDLWIREAGDPRVQPDAGHVERVRRLLLARTEVSRRRARWLRRMSLLAGVGIAAVLLIAVFPWRGGSSAAWAQVIEAVRARPWIHGIVEVSNGADSERGEVWYSPTMGIAASHHGEVITFDDLRLKIRQTYDPARVCVVRVPTPDFIGKEVESFDAMLREIFRNETEIGTPLPQTEVVNQRRREVEREGRRWIDYELSIRRQLEGPSGTILTGEMVIRVDPETRLPHSMRVTTLRPDVQVRSESVIQFDYPEEGPADIYALGVPRSAKVDDRVPVGDVARIVAANEVGRERLTSYCAVVMKWSGEPRDLLQPAPYRLWTTRNRWRLEWARTTPEVLEAVEAIRAAGELPADLGTSDWWKEHLARFDFTPSAICDGKKVYRAGSSDPKHPKKRKWEAHGNATAVTRGLAREYAVERHAYPSLPIPSADWTGTLDLHPKDGPSGTVLLTVRATRDYGANAYHIQRFWLDPARGYVTCRHELDGLQQPDVQATDQSVMRKNVYVMEDFKRSPQGVWYPTIVRRKNVIDQDEDGVRESDRTYRFWIDFDVDMPDSLFEAKDE